MFTKRKIEAIIHSKINEWINVSIPNTLECKSYPGTKLKDQIKQHYILTGGAIPSLLQGDEPKDYDIYFDNIHILYELVAYILRYISDWTIKEECYQPDPKFKWHQPSVPGSLTISEIPPDPNAALVNAIKPSLTTIPISVNAAHINAFYGDDIVFHNIKTGNKIRHRVKTGKGTYQLKFASSNSLILSNEIQVITRIVGNPAELHKTFDFIHCVSYYTEQTGLVLNKFAMESILTKELKYMASSPYPMCSIMRAKKFIQRGWTISDSELLKIMLDIVKLDTNKDTLAFQLQSGINSKWNKMLEKIDVPDLTEMQTQDLNRIIDQTT